MFWKKSLPVDMGVSSITNTLQRVPVFAQHKASDRRYCHHFERQMRQWGKTARQERAGARRNIHGALHRAGSRRGSRAAMWN
tara:strand:- start:1158 stop:1403 length:246 start_codon:yes stop_codon:yes gene_type:complete